MKFRLPPFLHLSALLLSSLSIFAQNASSLPKSYPEAEGVSSQGILRFIEAAEKSKNELHSFIFMRHGKVIAEGWWNPYKPSLRQSLYSTSKTFTSTAIGLAVAELELLLVIERNSEVVQAVAVKIVGSYGLRVQAGLIWLFTECHLAVDEATHEKCEGQNSER